MSFYIIIRGPLGCGKSTIAGKIAEQIKAQYLPIDMVLDEHELTNDWEDGYISQKSFISANSIIAPLAKKSLDSAMPVVFEGNFYWESQIDDLIKRLDFPNYVFTLKAPLEVCIARDSARENPCGEDAARAVYKKANEFDYGITIDVTKSENEILVKILSFLPN